MRTLTCFGFLVVASALVPTDLSAQGLRLPTSIAPTETIPFRAKDGTVIECTYNKITGARLVCRNWRAAVGDSRTQPDAFDQFLKGGKQTRDVLNDVQEHVPEPLQTPISIAKPVVDGFNLLLSSTIVEERRSQARRQSFHDHLNNSRPHFSPEAQAIMEEETRKALQRETERNNRRAIQGPASKESAPYAYDLFRDSLSVVTGGISDEYVDAAEEYFGGYFEAPVDQPSDYYGFPAGPTLPDGTFWAADWDVMEFADSFKGTPRSLEPRPVIPRRGERSQESVEVHGEFGGNGPSSWLERTGPEFCLGSDAECEARFAATPKYQVCTTAGGFRDCKPTGMIPPPGTEGNRTGFWPIVNGQPVDPNRMR